MMQNCRIDNVFRPAVGKWKPNILLNLSERPLRISELEDRLPDAHPRVLKRQMRSLEADGLVQKKTYTETPPKVEYSLTEYGEALAAILDELIKSATEHDILRKYDKAAENANKRIR